MADDKISQPLYYPIEIIYGTDKILTFTIGSQPYETTSRGCKSRNYNECTGSPDISGYDFSDHSFSAAIISTTDDTSAGEIELSVDESQEEDGIVKVTISDEDSESLADWVDDDNKFPTVEVGKWYLKRTEPSGEVYLEMYGKVSINLAMKQGVK